MDLLIFPNGIALYEGPPSTDSPKWKFTTWSN